LDKPWLGWFRTHPDGKIPARCYALFAAGVSFLCGAARFNYGSTVIVLLPPGVAELSPELAAESPVRLGQALARLVSSTP
jgi:phosphatidylserine decarboxylase